MSGRFNVFDEWGNKIGEFIPSDGSGGLAGLALLLVMAVLWTAGFLIYAVIAGFKAAIEGNWKKAFAFWAIPLIIIVIWVVSSSANAAAKEKQRFLFQEQQRQSTVQRDQLMQELSLTQIGIARRMKCDDFKNSSRWSNCYNYFVFLKFTVTNNSSVPIYLEGGYSRDPVIEPGQTKEFVIEDSSSWFDGTKFVPRQSNGMNSQLCLSFRTVTEIFIPSTGFSTTVGPFTVCQNITNVIQAEATETATAVVEQQLEPEFAIASKVVVTGTENLGLNIRSGTSSQFSRIKTEPEGTVLEIIGGPKEDNGFTWYQVRDDAGVTGWTIANYLRLQ